MFDSDFDEISIKYCHLLIIAYVEKCLIFVLFGYYTQISGLSAPSEINPLA